MSILLMFYLVQTLDLCTSNKKQGSELPIDFCHMRFYVGRFVLIQCVPL